MKKRLLGAFIVLFILITSLLLGNTVFSITMTVVSLLGLRELIDIKYKKRKIGLIKIISYLLMIFFMINNLVLKLDNKVVICISLISLILPIIFYDDKDRYNINDSLYLFGIIYFIGYAFLNIIDSVLHRNPTYYYKPFCQDGKSVFFYKRTGNFPKNFV